MTAGTPIQALGDLVRDHGRQLPLDLGLAMIAADEQPGLDIAQQIRALDELALRIHLRDGAPLFESIARLHMALFTDLGFRGDEEDYGNPRNSLLNQVLERRQGLPILLSAVYMELGRRLGLAVDGIGFPGHFMVSPHDEENRFYVDPFHGGKILNQDHLLERLGEMLGDKELDAVARARFIEPSNALSILVRVNNNLKRTWAAQDNLEGALRAVERNLLLEPEALPEQRDRGMILAELGRLDESIEQLETYLQQETSGWDQARVSAIIDVLRRR
jgi:regulator of sirC expression with transglutaminase-like and TPR domain